MASPPVEPTTGPVSGWGPIPRILIRFFFAYWLLYSFQLLVGFPVTLFGMALAQLGVQPGPEPPWWYQGVTYLSRPSLWFQQAMDWFTPWVCQTLIGVEVTPPTEFTGSGDGLYRYCTAFAYLVLALAATVLWTAVGELWMRLRTHRRPDYDRLHTLTRLVVRFHLMYQMLVYGAIKIWCSQFPPITDWQLEGKYGDSSPMGVLWKFMQSSQPYTSMTGLIEFACGLLLICRRTTLLGALCSAGATFQVFMLNMCYDVPVKLMSGHLLLMALFLIVPDVPRLFSFFVLGRPVAPRTQAPLFGSWRWLNRFGLFLRTTSFLTLAGLMLNQQYQEAKTRGILAPENPHHGRWIGKEFTRDGQTVPFPEQPDNPPPRQVTPSKWQGGPDMPAVVRVSLAPLFVTLMFADGSGVSYRTVNSDPNELRLVTVQDRRPVATLRISSPEEDVLVLEGPVGGQQVRMTLRRVPAPKKDYVFRSVGFRWVQERPFNPPPPNMAR